MPLPNSISIGCVAFVGAVVSGGGSSEDLSRTAFVSVSGFDPSAEIGNILLPYSSVTSAIAALSASPTATQTIRLLDDSSEEVGYYSSLDTLLSTELVIKGHEGLKTLTKLNFGSQADAVLVLDDVGITTVEKEVHYDDTVASAGTITGVGSASIANLILNGAEPGPDANPGASGGSVTGDPDFTGAPAPDPTDPGSAGSAGGHADAQGGPGDGGASGGRAWDVTLLGTLAVTTSVYAQGKNGKEGGPGGPGGIAYGGAGQRGGDAIDTGTYDGGPGGPGGDATASGGPGGNGGNGGSGGNIYKSGTVSLSASTIELSGGIGASGGAGGAAGATAIAGTGGAGGAGLNSGPPGADGTAFNEAGADGSYGTDGTAGSVITI